MRAILFLAFGLCCWVLWAGCGSSGTTSSATDSGPDQEVDSGKEADASVDVEPDTPGGPYECVPPNHQQQKGGGGLENCAGSRCVDGIGCSKRCDSDMDCLTVEELGGDPNCDTAYCYVDMGVCFFSAIIKPGCPLYNDDDDDDDDDSP